MAETLSHKFIAALELPRDELYGMALMAEGTQHKAEVRLRQVAGELFGKFTGNSAMDVAGAFRAALGSQTVPSALFKPTESVQIPPQNVSEKAPKAPQNSAMPADVWARLAASVQVEASKSTATKAINPDSVLLSPDPLLAPKKAAGNGPVDGLDLPGPSRFLLASGVVIVIGIVLTVYIATRPVTPRPTTPSASPGTTTLPTATERAR